MNYPFYENHREEDIPASLSHLAFRLARLRLALLAKLGWRGLISFTQQRALLKDLCRGLLLVPFYGTKLRDSGLARMIFSPRGVAATSRNSTGKNSTP